MLDYKLTIIAAMNLLGFIGQNGRIPWKSKTDMQFFKKTTINKTVIMGRKTFESLGKHPLTDRNNYVLTTNKQAIKIQPVQEGPTKLYFVDSIDAAINHFDRATTDIYIIGGELVYLEALQRDDLDSLILSMIGDSTLGDAMFPFYKIKHTLKQYWSEDFSIPGDPLLNISASVRLS